MRKAKRDVLVVGAGVFGLSIAFALVRAGRRVLVVDRLCPGAGASGGPVGALAPHPPHPWSEKKAFQRDVLLEAEDWWREVEDASSLDPGYARTGRVVPLRTTSERARAELRAEAAAFRWPDGAFWRVMEPGEVANWIAPECCPAGAVWENLTARVAPDRAIAALVRGVEAGGGSLQGRVEVVAVRPGEAVLSDETRLLADIVVVAAGTGSERLLAPVLGPGAVHGVKGQALRLRAMLPEDAPVLGDEGLWIVPHTDGTVAVGSTSEDRWEVEGPDEQLDPLLERSRALCPRLAYATVMERWAGLRPRTVGPDPLVGWAGPGLLVATAGFKTGFGLAPAVARLVADMAAGKAVSLPPGMKEPLVVGASPEI